MGEAIGYLVFGFLAWWLLSSFFYDAEEKKRQRERSKILHKEFLEERKEK